MGTPRHPTLVAGTALLLAACASRPPARPQGLDRAQATREVYAVALREVGRGAPAARYVVDPRARSGQALGLDRLSRLRSDTRADFLRAQGGGRLPADLDPGAPVTWFTETDWDALPEVPGYQGSTEGRWTTFRRQFPGAPGWTSFSVVGFSRDGRQAVVHVSHGEASLSGYADLFLLELRSCAWVVVDRVNLAIA